MELAAEIQDLLAQRAALRRELSTPPPPVTDVQPAASSPAPVVSSDKPIWKAFQDQIGTTFSTWDDAQDAWADARDAWKDTQVAAKQQHASETSRVGTVAKEWRQAVDAAIAADPDLWSKVPPALAACEPLSVARLRDPQVRRTVMHDIGEVIVTSPHKADWLRYFAAHPDVLPSLTEAQHPEQVYRDMGRIEATFGAPLASRTDASVLTPIVSSAPPPPPTLGSKPTDPSSEVDAALKTGDFRAYRLAKNREEMAQKR